MTDDPVDSASAVAVSPPVSPDDQRLIDGLRADDERIFEELVDRYHESLIRVARTFVGARSIAEEVAQETWIALIEGIDRFEGRSSLKTWLFRVLVYRSRSRGQRERRTIAMSELGDDDGPLVDPERFLAGDALWAGHWARPPQRWDGAAERRLIAAETRAMVEQAIERLPEGQRRVIALRDINGLSADEVCEMLQISEGNQRVLLHRARAKVRATLEEYINDE